MAVVRFSADLRSSIEVAAVRPFDVRYASEVQSLPTTYGPKIYEKTFGEFVPLMAQLPDGFFATTDSINLGSVRLSDGGKFVEKVSLGERTNAKNFPFGSKLRVPHDFSIPVINKKLISGGYSGYMYMADANDPEDLAFFNEVKAWRQRINVIKQEREEFLAAVREVIQKFTTLAPALKVWPPLWDLLPEATRQKHREVVEKVKRNPAEELTVDLDKMTGTVTRNKLLR